MTRRSTVTAGLESYTLSQMIRFRSCSAQSDTLLCFRGSPSVHTMSNRHNNFTVAVETISLLLLNQEVNDLVTTHVLKRHYQGGTLTTGRSAFNYGLSAHELTARTGRVPTTTYSTSSSHFVFSTISSSSSFSPVDSSCELSTVAPRSAGTRQQACTVHRVRGLFLILLCLMYAMSKTQRQSISPRIKSPTSTVVLMKASPKPLALSTDFPATPNTPLQPAST